MVLFDWAYDKKRGEQKGRERANAEWDAWLARREAAEKKGEGFSEPPPSQREKATAK